MTINHNKSIKAVPPYIHPGFLNFKLAPFEALKRLGGDVVKRDRKSVV